MKAIVYDKLAIPNRLVYQDVEKPIPEEDQVLIKIHAASVNASDYRSMQLGSIPKRKIFGADVAGVVEAVGNKVCRFQAGDAVLGDISACGLGGFAEYVAVSEQALAKIPDGVSFEDAAALPLAGVTALQALRDQGKIKPGHQVLINGAGGGVGTYAVQLAKYFGAEVTAVCSAKNAELMKSFGAEHVIDYTKENFTKNGIQYDLILAVNGNQSLLEYKRSLKAHGIYVMVGGAYSQIFKSILFGPFLSLGSKKMRFLVAKPNSVDLESLIGLVKEGKIKPIIDRRYPLSETAEAVRYLSEGHSRGKVIITVTNDPKR